MSIFSDFARKDEADKYNSAIFSLINYLCIRVGMTVKQKIEQQDIHPMELKLFKHISFQIKKIKQLEQDKHNQPMFSAACSKLAGGLQTLMDSQSRSQRTVSNEPTSGVESSFSSIHIPSTSNALSFKSKISAAPLGSVSSQTAQAPLIIAQGGPSGISSNRQEIRSRPNERKASMISRDPKREIHIIPERTIGNRRHTTHSVKAKSTNASRKEQIGGAGTTINAGTMIININQNMDNQDVFSLAQAGLSKQSINMHSTIQPINEEFEAATPAESTLEKMTFGEQRKNGIKHNTVVGTVKQSVEKIDELGNYSSYGMSVGKNTKLEFKQHRSVSKKNGKYEHKEKKFAKTLGYRNSVTAPGKNRVKLANIQNSYGLGLGQKLAEARQDGSQSPNRHLLESERMGQHNVRRILAKPRGSNQSCTSFQQDIDQQRDERRKLATAERPRHQQDMRAFPDQSDLPAGITQHDIEHPLTVEKVHREVQFEKADHLGATFDSQSNLNNTYNSRKDLSNLQDPTKFNLSLQHKDLLKQQKYKKKGTTMNNGFTLYPTNKAQLQFVTASGNSGTNKYFVKPIADSLQKARRELLSRTASEECSSNGPQGTGLRKETSKFKLNLNANGVELFNEDKQLFSDRSTHVPDKTKTRAQQRARTRERNRGTNDYILKVDRTKKQLYKRKNNDISYLINARKQKGVRFEQEVDDNSYLPQEPIIATETACFRAHDQSVEASLISSIEIKDQ